MAPMRRRIRSAAFPLHRHSLPQLAVDGALVAFAYYLAFQLRFDSGVKGSYLLLLQRTWWWAMVISLVVFTLFRLYQRWWRYAGQRDYEAILRAVVVSTLALVGAVAVLHPVVRQVGLHTVTHHTASGRLVSHRVARTSASLGLPNGVIALYFLITLTFVSGTRFIAHAIYERPFGRFRGSKDAREVLIVGAGTHGARPRRGLPERGNGPGHRSGRIGGLRALPADRARGSPPPGAARSRRGQPVRDPARARGRPSRPSRHAGQRAGRLQGGGAHTRGVHRVSSGLRVPRRRLQARRPHGGQPG